MSVILLLTVHLVITGELHVVTIPFHEKNMSECDRHGSQLTAESTPERAFSYVCQIEE